MKKKIYEITNSVDSLNKLSTFLFDKPQDNRRFYRLLKFVNEINEEYLQYQKNLILEYGEKLENGGVELKPNTDNFIIANKVLNEYASQEIEIGDDISKFIIPYEKIDKYNMFNARDYEIFDKFGFIEFTEN